MTPKTMQVQAVAHKDVRGKEQLYLKIHHAGNDVIINIGKGTFDAVTKLAEATVHPLPLEQKDKKGGKEK